jgi:hypothetical protein
VDPITYDISRRTPTLNDWNGAPRWKYPSIRETWLAEIRWAEFNRRKCILTAPGPTRARMVVTVTRILRKGDRLYDDDNARGGCKPILDALRKAGVIHNDSPRWCRLEVVQRRDLQEKGHRTVIEIRDAHPAE